MLQESVERTIVPETPQEALPAQVPAELWGYAKAFLLIRRPTLRFVWRQDTQWLDVQLSREAGAAGSAIGTERAFVRVSPSEMPRGLTVRELDVLTLVALGHTNGGVAERLGTSARTVSTQLERLLEKLGQSSRGGLAALAVDLGLLRLPLPGGAPEAGGLGVAELELAYQRRLTRGHRPIREDTSVRVPIRLGIIVPEPATSEGKQVLHGSMLAVEEINQQGGIGGRLIEPVRADIDLFDWQSVRSGLDRLFLAGVDAIVTSYVSSEHPEVLDLVSGHGKPFLHTATFEADVLRAEREPWKYGMVFQTCASETYYGPGMLRLATQLEQAGLWEPKAKRVVPIEMPSASMRLATPAFRSAAEACGWTIADTIQTSFGSTNWDAVVSQAAADQPDIVLFANYLEQEFVAFQQAFLRSPFPALIYGIYAPSNPAFMKQLGSGADGVIWSTTTGTYDDDLGSRFRRQYRARYREDPGWSMAGALYDQVRMLAAAWSAVDAGDVAEVITHLRRWPYRGVNGVYYFGDSGHTPKLYPDTTSDAALSQAHLIYQIQQGEHTLISPEPFGRISDFSAPSWMY